MGSEFFPIWNITCRHPLALHVKADALYHLGNFEHALVYYHRGLRWRYMDKRIIVSSAYLGLPTGIFIVLTCIFLPRFVPTRLSIDN